MLHTSTSVHEPKRKRSDWKEKSSHRECCCNFMDILTSSLSTICFPAGRARTWNTRQKKLHTCMLINNSKTNKNVLVFWERLLESRKKRQKTAVLRLRSSRFLETTFFGRFWNNNNTGHHQEVIFWLFLFLRSSDRCIILFIACACFFWRQREVKELWNLIGSKMGSWWYFRWNQCTVIKTVVCDPSVVLCNMLNWFLISSWAKKFWDIFWAAAANSCLWLLIARDNHLTKQFAI